MDATAWHEVWAEVAGEAVAAAVGQLGLRTGGMTLDVGTGGGLALPALAKAVGRRGRVHAIDVDEQVLAMARRRADASGAGGRIYTEVQRVEALIERGPRQQFDAIWAADVLWPNYFPDPYIIVRGLVDLLKPGGTLGVFTANWYASRFLPARLRLESRLQAANALRWQVPADGDGRHHEQAGGWLHAAGLTNVRATLHPIAGSQGAPQWAAWRRYLEVGVWPDYLASADSYGGKVGLSVEELGQLRRWLDPSHRDYLPLQPGYLAFQPAMLWVGSRGRS